MGALLSLLVVYPFSRTGVEYARYLFTDDAVNVISATYTGSGGAISTFEEGPYGIGRGLLLTTGYAVGANGPFGPVPAYGDTDHANEEPGSSFCGSGNSFDGAVLSMVIDIDADTDGLRINFILASAEYNRRGTADPVGVWLDGVQYAVDPDGNQLTAQSVFLQDPLAINTPDSFTYYSGSTPSMTFPIPATSGRHDLVIAVCDIGDLQYDTGLMIQAKLCTGLECPSKMMIDYGTTSTTTLEVGEATYRSVYPPYSTIPGSVLVAVTPDPTPDPTPEQETPTPTPEDTPTPELTPEEVPAPAETPRPVDAPGPQETPTPTPEDTPTPELTPEEIPIPAETPTPVDAPGPQETPIPEEIPTPEQIPTPPTLPLPGFETPTPEEPPEPVPGSPGLPGQPGQPDSPPPGTSPPEESPIPGEPPIPAVPSMPDIDRPVITPGNSTTIISSQVPGGAGPGGAIPRTSRTTNPASLISASAISSGSNPSVPGNPISRTRVSSAVSAGPSNLATISGYRYLGCLGSMDGFPTFTEIFEELETPIERCIELADGATFVGIFQGSCFVADLLTSADLVANGQCDLPCPFNPRQTCGGLSRFMRRDESSLVGRGAPAGILMTLYGLIDEGEVAESPTSRNVLPTTALATPPVPTAPEERETDLPSSDPPRTDDLPLPAPSGDRSTDTRPVVISGIATVTTTVTYTTVDPINSSLVVTETCFTLSYHPCQCASQPIPSVVMTTVIARCSACGYHGGDEVTLTIPEAVMTALPAASVVPAPETARLNGWSQGPNPQPNVPSEIHPADQVQEDGSDLKPTTGVRPVNNDEGMHDQATNTAAASATQPTVPEGQKEDGTSGDSQSNSAGETIAPVGDSQETGLPVEYSALGGPDMPVVAAMGLSVHLPWEAVAVSLLLSSIIVV